MKTSVPRIRPGDRVRLLPFRDHGSYLPDPARFGDIVFVDGVLENEDVISFDGHSGGWALSAVEKVGEGEWDRVVAELELDEKRNAARGIVGAILKDLAGRIGGSEVLGTKVRAEVETLWEGMVVEGLKDWQDMSLAGLGELAFNLRLRRAAQLKAGRKSWDPDHVDPKWRADDDDPTDPVPRVDLT